MDSEYEGAILSDDRAMRGRPALPAIVFVIVLEGVAVNAAVDADGIAPTPGEPATTQIAAEPWVGGLLLLSALTVLVLVVKQRT